MKHKVFFRFLTALAVLLCLLPAGVAASALAESGDLTYNGVVFKAWTDELAREQNGEGRTAKNSLPRLAGDYRLTSDVYITEDTINDGPFLLEEDDAVLNLHLDGYTVTAVFDGPFFNIQKGIVNLYDSTDNLGAYVRGEGTKGAGADIGMTGTFNMYGGRLIGCSTAVDMLAGTFNMYGGEISECGMGVFSDNSTVNIYGGSINSNTDTGIYMHGGTLTMSGGEIVSNSSDSSLHNCGGVYLEGASFTMSGGEIRSNFFRGDGCGGVYVTGGGSFTLSGGSIDGNFVTGDGSGGVYLDNGTFTLSQDSSGGYAVITDNRRGGDADSPLCNVYLKDGKLINVSGTPDENTRVGVTMENPGVFTASVPSAGLRSLGDIYSDIFLSDDSGYGVQLNDQGEAMLVPVYSLNALSVGAGSLSLDHASAMSGDRVAATARPDDGCDLDCVYYTPEGGASVRIITIPDGNGNHIGDFTMPAANVTVTAIFVSPSPGPDFTLPTKVQSIGDNAFEGIAATTVHIPDGCGSIGAYAFRNCLSLSQIHIPDSVTDIEDTAFDGCGTVYVFSKAGSAAETLCKFHQNLVFVNELS